jgi:predicted nucleic acid-binding protein
MRVRKIVVHTDVLLDHLRTNKRPSVLRVAMGRYFCYTTVFNAVELFALAGTKRERERALEAIGAIKVLGLSSRSALLVGGLVARYSRRKGNNIMIAGMCLEAGLPLLTAQPGVFAGITGLRVVTPAQVMRRTR